MRPVNRSAVTLCTAPCDDHPRSVTLLDPAVMKCSVRGNHPVVAPHGDELYYLNVMAGPNRLWVFCNDPAHEWMLAR